MKKIAIAGAGFSGMMVAVHLLRSSQEPIEIILIDPNPKTGSGVAYDPYSPTQLLNVVTEKMSAFKNDQDHFLNWVMAHPDYRYLDRNLMAQAFLPRVLYGQYLQSIWEDTLLQQHATNAKVNRIHDKVKDLDIQNENLIIDVENHETFKVDELVIATGNHPPANLKIQNMDFYKSSFYFQNPWSGSTVEEINNTLDVCIIGTGLTMVDTILGLKEKNYKGKIHALSPHGFNILPHRHSGIKYTKWLEELPDKIDLYNIVKLFNKHIKLIKKFGLSAEPVIDAIRPHTQRIWLALNANEKARFMKRFRHLWGLARHRIPIHINDYIQQLRMEQSLLIYSGNLLDITERNGVVSLRFYDKKKKKEKVLEVGRVINCTGPETDIERSSDQFLNALLNKGIITQDPLKLGINADPNSFQVLNSSGVYQKNIYTVGSHLKGMLWESTAVNELRDQAERLAQQLLKKQP